MWGEFLEPKHGVICFNGIELSRKDWFKCFATTNLKSYDSVEDIYKGYHVWYKIKGNVIIYNNLLISYSRIDIQTMSIYFLKRYSILNLYVTSLNTF